MKRTERIARLREKSVSIGTCYEEFGAHFFDYIEKNGCEYNYDSYGDAYIYACEQVSVNISDDELIVGKPSAKFPNEDIEALWYGKAANSPGRAKANAMWGQDSHMAIDYEMLLGLGVSGVIARIEGYEKECLDKEKLAFYACAKKCLEGVLHLSERYSEKAKELADKCCDETRKKELYRISEICKKVPLNAPESFYEAVQCAHFVTYCLSNDPQRQYLQYQLGRPDRYLYKFYENDIKNGVITKSQAQELIDCLCIQINNRVTRGMSSGYMVGGRDGKSVVVNDLTYMCLDSIENIKLVYPSVGLCFNKDMPDALLERACEILSEGCSHPAIFNDDIIAEGLKLYGVPEEDCYSYIHSTCVEITPIASSNVWVADPYTNTLELLLDILDREYADFDELKKALLEHFAERIKNNFEHMNAVRVYRSENSMFPLVSCFVKDCLAKGTDIDAGGARYNWIMPSFVGMANLTDSLYAVKKVVFDNKEMSMAELKKIIDSNFEGNEALRL